MSRTGLWLLAALIASSAEAKLVLHSPVLLKSGPGAEYDTQGVAKPGDELTVIGCTDAEGWCSVRAQHASGWVPASAVSGDAQSEPNAEERRAIVRVGLNPSEPSGGSLGRSRHIVVQEFLDLNYLDADLADDEFKSSPNCPELVVC